MRAAAHQVGLAIFKDRHDAFAERAELGRSFFRVRVNLREIIDVGFRKHVTGIGKCGDPLAVLLLRVPPDMVVMQMRAHHHVDFFRPRAGGREPFEIRQIEHVPERPAGLRLVVAAARVDQDFLAADLQQPAVDGEPDLPGLGLIVVRRQPGLVLGHVGVGEIRKDVPQRIAREIGFLDPRDLCIADTEHRHLLTGFIFSAETRW